MSDDTKTLPNVEATEPAPLRVVPKVHDAKAEFIRDTIAYALIMVSVASVIYVLFYAASAGWHDAAI